MPRLLLAGKIVLITLFLLPDFLAVAPAFAQSTDVTTVYEISGQNVTEGDILVSTADKGLAPATLPYDSHIFGILQNQSLLVLRRVDNAGKAIIRNGTASVNVTTLGGPIGVGDYITSSEIPGVGQKATASGYVIGVALTSFSEADGAPLTVSDKVVKSGKISVALKIEYAEITQARTAFRLLDLVGASIFSSVKDPSKAAEIFRYLAAGAIVLASFTFGFFTFSRSVPKAIEAIGRNPLAEKAILFSVILNISFTVVTVAVGVIAAFFVLRL